MKRIIALVLAVCMCFALVACGGNSDKDSGKKTGAVAYVIAEKGDT